MLSSDCRSQIFEMKKFDDPNFSQRCLNQSQNWVFCHFLKFGSLVFFEIAYKNSMQQFLTSSRGKIHKFFFGGVGGGGGQI